jgi:hypothetical protein
VAGHWSLRGWLVGEVEGPLQAVAELTLGLERCAVEADLWQLHLLRAEYALDQLERHPVDVGLAAEVRESLTWLSRAEFAVEPERYSRIFRSAGRLGDPDLARALWNRLDAQQQGQAATLYANFLAPLLDREGH